MSKLLKLLTIFLLVGSSAQSQVFMTNYMVERTPVVDSLVTFTNHKVHAMPTVIEFTEKNLYLKNELIDEKLTVESLICKDTFLFRNQKGEVFVVKIQKVDKKDQLTLIGTKEYLFAYEL